MPESHNSGDVTPLSRLRAQLAGPRGARRLDALLSASDAQQAVAALSVPDLYQLIKDIGLADCYELVALAAPQQVRGCLDLEAWEADRLQLAGVTPWLAAVVEAGFEKVGEVWACLDAEFTALLFARWARIYDLSLGESPDDDPAFSPDDGYYTTPDTFFALRFVGDSETNQLSQRLLEDLYRADMVLARHTLMTARSELQSGLEEYSYRWRSGRLADLGYVEYYEALEVFRPLDLASVSADEDTATQEATIADDEAAIPLPTTLAESVVSASFLARALDRLGDANEQARLERAFVVLTNRVLSAERIAPNDSENMVRISKQAIATVSLGLEAIARGDVGRAAAVLRSASLMRIHRVGYTLTMRFVPVARAMAPHRATVGEPASTVIGGLTQPRPQFACALEDPAATEWRPFESADDLRRSARELTILALRLAIADALGADAKALATMPPPRPQLDDYARTAVVRCLGDHGFAYAPLSVEELRRFVGQWFVGGRWVETPHQRVHTSLLACVTEAGVTAGLEFVPALVSRWLVELEQKLGGLSPAHDIDVRFVDGVILRAASS